jgi:hypothetical protein
VPMKIKFPLAARIALRVFDLDTDTPLGDHVEWTAFDAADRSATNLQVIANLVGNCKLAALERGCPVFIRQDFLRGLAREGQAPFVYFVDWKASG